MRVSSSFRYSIVFCSKYSLNQYIIGLAQIDEGNDETKTFENKERSWASMIEPMANFAEALVNSMRMFSR